MTPDEDYDTRRIDGLLASFGELMKAEAVLTERVRGHDEALVELRDAVRDATKAMSDGMREVSKTCEDHTRRVEMKIDEQVRVAQANKWSPTQWAAILGPAITALIGAAALILTGGPHP